MKNFCFKVVLEQQLFRQGVAMVEKEKKKKHQWLGDWRYMLTMALGLPVGQIFMRGIESFSRSLSSLWLRRQANVALGT